MAGATPLQLSTSSSSSAEGRSMSGFDNSGFVVNYGGALSAGPVPSWLIIAAAVGAFLWLRKR